MKITELFPSGEEVFLLYFKDKQFINRLFAEKITWLSKGKIAGKGRGFCDNMATNFLCCEVLMVMETDSKGYPLNSLIVNSYLTYLF